MGARQELVPSGSSMPALPATRSFEPLPPDEDTSWFLDALQVLIEQRRVIATVLALAAVALTGYVLTAPQTRLFEARAQILVEPDSSAPLDAARASGTVDPEGSYYETQFRVMRSRSLARLTLTNLAASSAPKTGAPAAAPPAPPRGATNPAPNTPPSGTPPTGKSSIEAAPADAAPIKTGPTGAGPADAGPIDAGPIDASTASAVDAFLRALTIVHVPESRLVEVRFISADPAYAARAVNAHTQAYVHQREELTRVASRQASSWLARQLEEQRTRVEMGEAALQRYRQHDGAIEQRQAIVSQRLSELNGAVLRARGLRVSRETAYQQVVEAQRAGKSPRDLAGLVSTPLIQSLSIDLAGLQRRDLELATQYGPRHPERIKIQEALDFTETRLDAEVNRAIEVMRRDVQAARQEESRTAGALEAQTAESSAVGRKTDDYDALNREVANDRALFEKLQQRARELRMSSDYELTNVRIIDAAEVPRAPLPDTRWRNVAMGAGASVVLALMLAFALHYLNQRLRTPEDITTHLGLPYLGMVPKLSPKAFEGSQTATGVTGGATEGAGARSRQHLPPPFKEALRDLRTHVLCTPAGQASHILLVASAGKDEGKTLVATHLASALAQVGYRVLLIDLDLRRPSLHQAFDLPLRPGLSELLSTGARARDAIRPSTVRDLWILPAGHPLTNPGDLLGSPAFRQMLQTLTKSFDRIVLDSPPVMAVTDASLVAHEQVGVLFVVSADRTSRRAAQAALDRLEAVGARFVGAVLNRVDLKRDASPAYMHYDDAYGEGDWENARVEPETRVETAPAPMPAPVDVHETRAS